LINIKLYSTFFLLFISCGALAELSFEEQIARDKGIVLYQQSAWESAQPFLKIAAAAGDSKAQYYLGEAIRLNNMFMTAEARKWYEASAEQGDLFAMLRLSSSDDLCKIIGTCEGRSGEEWRKYALKKAHERSNEGDPEAMRVLYILGQGLSWLEKAAETGDSYSQYSLAVAYKNGNGWFLIPGSREKAIERWAKASAEGGFVRGMYFYADFLYTQNEPREEVGYWLKKTVDAGYIDAIGGYALNVAHLPDRYGFPLNLVEAYGLTYLLSKLKGGGMDPEHSKNFLAMIAEKMTAEEIQQGIAYAAEWEKTHPPLSFYPPVYGY